MDHVSHWTPQQPLHRGDRLLAQDEERSPLMGPSPRIRGASDPIASRTKNSLKQNGLKQNDLGQNGLRSKSDRIRSAFRAIRPSRTRRGVLTPEDALNPLRPDRFVDAYRLKGVRPNQQVRIRVASPDFDPFIHIVNARTGDRIVRNDDNGRSTNSQVSFVVQPGTIYEIRVSSYAPRETGSYRLSARALTPSIRDFSFAYGHGLIDAAAAVDAARSLALAQNISPPVLTPPDEAALAQVDQAQWNLRQINAESAWRQGTLGQDVVVAVVDSGVSLHHPDLRFNLWRNRNEIPNNGRDDDGNGFVDDFRGWDFIQNDGKPSDRDIHGTHVAGIVAASLNDTGVTGVAPEATIMPVRVLDRQGSGSAQGVAQGIRYAVNNGADVINLSLGSPPGTRPSLQIRRALRFAHRRGVLVAIAAGNERDRLGTAQPGEPAFWAASQGVAIAVGAVNRNRRVASFSNPTGNRAVNPFVVAPGVEVNSLAALWLRNAFGPANVDRIEPLALSGTSMATPHVAGVAALMFSVNPELTVDQAIQIIVDTSNPSNLKAV